MSISPMLAKGKDSVFPVLDYPDGQSKAFMDEDGKWIKQYISFVLQNMDKEDEILNRIKELENKLAHLLYWDVGEGDEGNGKDNR